MFKTSKWSWKKGGFFLGSLVTLVYLMGERLGTSGAYTKAAARLTQLFSPALVQATFLTQPGGCEVPAADSALMANLGADWQVMAVVGIAAGAFLAKKTSKEKPAYAVPPMWERHFGRRWGARYLQAFLGGFLLLFGARLAGGCTSSQVISGMSRMALSGLVFGLAVFAAGIPTAMLIYRRRRVQP
jgi:uncharacterized protein